MADLAARLGPRCLVAAVVTVSVLAFGGPASADFVGLLLQGSLQVTSYTCNPNGTSTVAFVASGQSQASYPGTFTATGTFTLDAQTQPGYFDDNFLPVGTLLSWSENFEIDSGSSVITGTSNSVAVPPPGFQISGATINTGVCAFEQNVTLGQVTNATGTVIQVYGTVGAHASGASVPTGTFASSVAVELLIQSSSIGPFQASSFAQAFFCCTTTPDPEPPVVSVTSPAEGAAFLLGQPVAADYSCNAQPGSLDLMSCLGDVPSGQLIDTATDGAKTFTVSARDFAGLMTTVVRHYSVLAGSAVATVAGGGTVTTDPAGNGATASAPLQTALSIPSGAPATEVTIVPAQTTDAPPAGFGFFGNQVTITTGGATADPASPYVVTFTVDASLVGGVAAADVQVFRDGSPISDCLDPVGAIPDACVASRTAGSDGDALVTVRTSHFSRWNFGRLAYSFVGFTQPVDNLPIVNTVKAGSAVPVKFSLGGNQGLNVFQSGYPRQIAYNCDSAPTDAVEQTVSAGGSSLTYDSTSSTYTYVWKSDKAWVGTCRELTLKFRDGTAAKARFQFPR